MSSRPAQGPLLGLQGHAPQHSVHSRQDCYKTFNFSNARNFSALHYVLSAVAGLNLALSLQLTRDDATVLVFAKCLWLTRHVTDSPTSNQGDSACRHSSQLLSICRCPSTRSRAASSQQNNLQSDTISEPCTTDTLGRHTSLEEPAADQKLLPESVHVLLAMVHTHNGPVWHTLAGAR